VDIFSHDVVERAARTVLETSAAVTVVSATHSNHADGAFSELIATLSLVGKTGGTLVVYCTKQQAVRLAAGMLGDADTEPETETVLDAIGEMVNQIGGTIKRYVGADGSEIMLSPPVVVAGSPLSHCVRSTAIPLAVALDFGLGDLAVCLWPA
jgi:CheY-specific phosphatase CheX